MKTIIALLTLFICLDLYAKKGPITGLDLPRFVSLKSDDVNLRVGPSVNYPIKIKYVKSNLPVEILDEYDVWRKVQDHENNIGWLHKSLIKGDRFVLTIDSKDNKNNIYNRPNGKIIGIAEKNNILNLESCLINWCYISNQNIKGWLAKDFIWGIYKEEIYNESFFQPIIDYYWKFLESNFLKQIINFIIKILD